MYKTFGQLNNGDRYYHYDESSQKIYTYPIKLRHYKWRTFIYNFDDSVENTEAAYGSNFSDIKALINYVFERL